MKLVHSRHDVEITDTTCPDCGSRIVAGTCPKCGEQSPLDIARDLARCLRDVLHELNLDDPGDDEAKTAPRLTRAERHASSVVKLLSEIK